MCEEEMESTQFCFNEWADTHGLTRTTTGILSKEGCNTKEILEVLSSSAVSKLGLSIGQGIALRKGLRALGNRAGGVQIDAAWDSPNDNRPKRRREGEGLFSDSQPASGQRWRGDQLEQEVENDLDEFLKDPEGQDPLESGGRGDKYQGGAYGPDPRINLVIKSQKRKPLRIANFVPDSVARRTAGKGKERVALVQGADGKLMVKEDDDLPSHLTLSEWGAANLRLLQHLLDSGELARADIGFYNAYTLMIFEFVENYEWPSILAFDSRYRELQAHTSFPWGTPSRGLEVSTLIPRARKDKQKERPKGRNGTRGEKKGLCRTFAREGSCPYGERCIFLHKVDRQEGPKNGGPLEPTRER